MIVSIDCWGTLIKGSSTFHQIKLDLVREFFGDIPEHHIKRSFRITKELMNDFIEKTGGCQPTQKQIFTYLATTLKKEYDNFDFIEEFIKEYNKLAVKYSPELYCFETLGWLKRIREVSDEVAISSNTMFVSGDSLQEILIELDVADYITQFNFSDQMGLAKPHKAMYYGSDYHIGDNPLTDGIGAAIAKSKPFIINSNYKSLNDAYNYILQRG